MRTQKVGTDGEALIAAYLSPSWIVTRAGEDLQRRGVDLVLTSKNGDGNSYTVEVKTDHRADGTGNAFVELRSTRYKGGWAIACRADYLFYVLPQTMLVYVLSPRKIRAHLLRWRGMYPMLSIDKEDYETIGISVPFHELEKIGKVLYLQGI